MIAHYLPHAVCARKLLVLWPPLNAREFVYPYKNSVKLLVFKHNCTKSLKK